MPSSSASTSQTTIHHHTNRHHHPMDWTINKQQPQHDQHKQLQIPATWDGQSPRNLGLKQRTYPRVVPSLTSANPCNFYAVRTREWYDAHYGRWHAPNARMTARLRAARAPATAIAKVHEIVDTWRPCRNWATPSPKPSTTSRPIEAFNHTAQHYLMFVSPNPWQHQHSKQDPRAEPWQHLIDCCCRLSQATILSTKTTQELNRTFEMAWVRPYGPPTNLESDQESGLVTDEAELYLQR